jgi:endo-1,4-beta-xylanase
MASLFTFGQRSTFRNLDGRFHPPAPEVRYHSGISRLVKTAVLIVMVIAGLLPQKVPAQPFANGKNKFLGSSVSSIRSDFTKYWNQVTPENAGKWGSVEGTIDSYNWTPLDNIYNFAIANGFAYKHHNFVWGNQQPSWITTLDSANQRAQVEEWIRLAGARYPKMTYVDVVNEPLHAPPSYKNALGGNGATGWDWVVTTFQWARKYCPTAKLLINEYNILQSNTVTDQYISLIDTLIVRGLIDGIGIQGHYFEFKGSGYTYSISTLQGNLNRLAALGLPIYISEFDIDESDDAAQSKSYQTYFPLFWDNPAVKGITLWGYAENTTWKPYAFVVDARGAARPALTWLSAYVAGPRKPVPLYPVAADKVQRNPTLRWAASPTATSYNVQMSEDSTFSSVFVNITVTDTIAYPGLLRSNTTLYWRVNATNQYGASDYSAGARFTTGDLIVLSVEASGDVPGEFALHQNYPNPFNPSTAISFQLSAVSFVRLSVYDELGREIVKLVNEEKPAGFHTVTWDARNVPSGVYMCRIVAGDHIATRKMLLVK